MSLREVFDLKEEERFNDLTADELIKRLEPKIQKGTIDIAKLVDALHSTIKMMKPKNPKLAEKFNKVLDYVLKHPRAKEAGRRVGILGEDIKAIVEGLNAIREAFREMGYADLFSILHEAKTQVRIKVKRPGHLRKVLGIPEDEPVFTRPIKDIIKRCTRAVTSGKVSYAHLIRMLNAVRVWNKNRNPRLSKRVKRIMVALRALKDAGKLKVRKKRKKK